MACDKLRELRELGGFIPDQALYEFSETVVRAIILELRLTSTPLTEDQLKIVLSYFPR